ncbi:uncharacterized protein BCR38DRAFT_136506 [Pseudomassariella vexata]|uniref:Secreted protein n=1 Tax=Pseudomassariella vexata TaxID=1141098 RepID=A0A1Y2EB90_9PEZI|nr:uncharacterized protein BCR38DRAFT_136506 [Pseudomassariella vexata]ORY68677.1 hypothetical protein BCR38DRAFT_136506 [Pseudomassariella vexata]
MFKLMLKFWVVACGRGVRAGDAGQLRAGSHTCTTFLSTYLEVTSTLAAFFCLCNSNQPLPYLGGGPSVEY